MGFRCSYFIKNIKKNLNFKYPKRIENIKEFKNWIYNNKFEY